MDERLREDTARTQLTPTDLRDIPFHIIPFSAIKLGRRSFPEVAGFWGLGGHCVVGGKLLLLHICFVGFFPSLFFPFLTKRSLFQPTSFLSFALVIFLLVAL